jgi:CRP-like cAMP-binding protein
MDLPEQLRQFDLFNSASEQEMCDLVRGCVHKNIAKETIVLREGDLVKNVYFIIDGHFQVYLSNSAGKEIILKDLYSRSSFGELGVLCDSRRSANVVAKTSSNLIVINESCFRNYFENNINAARFIITILATSLSRLTDDYENLALYDLNHRLIRILIKLSVKNNDRYVVTQTHGEIANRISSTRESVSRAISIMKDKHLIESDVEGIILTEHLLEFYNQA